MWAIRNILFLMLLVYPQSWAYCSLASTLKIHQLPVDGLLLDKGWKYMPGDNLDWASPDFNDQDWQVMDPTQDIHDLPALWQSNIGWFRLRFSLDSSLHQESLALLVEQTGASEIFLNGRLIGKYGQISSQPEQVRAAYPPFGEFISFQPGEERNQVLAVRFALQKDIPYVNFAGRYNRAVALKVMEMEAVTRYIRSNPHFLDYIKASIFFILSLLHLVLFSYSPSRKGNLYFFIFSLMSTVNFSTAGFLFQHVQLAAPRMLLIIFIFSLYTASCFFYLLATYSIFNHKKGLVFWLLFAAFLLTLPLFLRFYQAGWWFGLMIFPISAFLESARITFLADHKKMRGVRVVSYGAAAFIVFYTLYMATFFGFLPAGPDNFWGHLTFNLGILSLPISLSIYLATEASFTSRSLEAKLVEVQQLSEKNLLQEREKAHLQATDEIKSRFFANISHEFRTPLSLIRGTVEKLRKKEEGSSEIQLDYGTIDRSAGRLLQMVSQLLDLSRLEAGKLVLHPQPENISDLLKVLGGSFASLFEGKEITYRYTVPLQPVWVEVDSEKLEQLINNLLSNAAKFTPAQGEVSFLATVQMVDADSCSLLIIVQDTGVGIPASQLPRIFDRFYQADSSATRQYEGTGIGLALVKELVQMQGGQIKAESIEGKGSTFTLQLPLLMADAREVAEREQDRPVKSLFSAAEVGQQGQGEPSGKRPAHSGCILVVEDNADLRHFLSGCLSESYAVKEAENGWEGYRLAIETMPEVIISDIMMPGLDGVSLCQKLKEDIRTSHIPFILLTAKADEETKIRSLRTGADDYLTKPFSTEELRLRVDNLILQRKKLREKFTHSYSLPPGEGTAGSADELFLGKVLAVMEENLANADFDVDAFSRAIGMSRTHLNRKLTAVVNQSPSEFIRAFRLKRAADLLRQNQRNIAEISFMVGFSSPNYFTKCFHDQFGVAPSEYLLSTKATEGNLP